MGKKIVMTFLILFGTGFLFAPALIAQCIPDFEFLETIYKNPLSGVEDLQGVIIESGDETQPNISFDNKAMRLSSDVHFLMWFPESMPDSIAISWDFLPKNDNGLAMLWFCATGKEGEDLFDQSLEKRSGQYPQYHSGDINAYHLAYFRRNPWDDPYINTVNLRKSYGNLLVAQGPNPIPNLEGEKVKNSIKKPYRMMVIKYGSLILLKINDLLVFHWQDEKPYTVGKIGFRQMANLEAEYGNLLVKKIEKIDRDSRNQTKAFTGAEGFGRYAKGGRGGDVYYVDNLHDSGVGSLRYGVESADGPRTILFKVSGIINLNSPLIISNPFLTIAGQTAPGDGVCIKNYGVVIRKTHDIIIRHVRFRPGDEIGKRLIAEGKVKSWATDGLSIYQSSKVIIDHCSASWGIDETLSATGVGLDSITIQNTFITESLNNSTHPKGNHGYGSIINGHATGTNPKTSVFRTLYAHHDKRNPNFAGDRQGNPPGSYTDFRNNVVYNWGSLPSHSYNPQYTSVNWISNYYKPGPSTHNERIALSPGSKNLRVYANGNHMTSLPSADEDNWRMVDKTKEITVLDEPVPVFSMPTLDAIAAYELVLESSGAFPRDEIDTRMVEHVRNRSGHIIDSPDEVGGWPEYSSEIPPVDSDQDGMPDEWEDFVGLNSKDPKDGNSDRNSDGYTNLEEYLHWQHEQVMKK